MKARVWLALILGGHAWAAAALPQGKQLTLRCEVAYLPARSTWVREVRLDWQGKVLQQVLIDGVVVHSFSLYPGGLQTAVDNERIRLDWNAALWQSDFRGLASGQGRCEVR